jgi:hypothetical protein
MHFCFSTHAFKKGDTLEPAAAMANDAPACTTPL